MLASIARAEAMEGAMPSSERTLITVSPLERSGGSAAGASDWPSRSRSKSIFTQVPPPGPERISNSSESVAISGRPIRNPSETSAGRG